MFKRASYIYNARAIQKGVILCQYIQLYMLNCLKKRNEEKSTNLCLPGIIAKIPKKQMISGDTG